MQQQILDTLPDIRHVIDINAPIQKVWQAVATSEGIAAWFMPNDFQPKLGHEFTLQTQFGPIACKVLDLDPPHVLSFSWGDFGWRVSFALKDLKGKTEFTLIHAGWGKPDDILPMVSEKHSVIHAKMNEGWGYLTRGLRDKLTEA
jgi:uncharacterized protein YndB with AHSA1/START domain